MTFSSIFSARTTNPDGRNGRRPTTVRMMRSAETLTGTNRRRGTRTSGWREEAHADARPAAIGKPAKARKSRRFTTDYRLPTTDYRLPTTDYRLPTPVA